MRVTRRVDLSNRATLLTNTFAFADRHLNSQNYNIKGLVVLKSVEMRKLRVVLGDKWASWFALESVDF